MQEKPLHEKQAQKRQVQERQVQERQVQERQGRSMAETRIIHGFHAVISRIRQNADGVSELYVDSQRRDPRARDLLKLAETHAVRVVPVDSKRLDGMTGNTRHQGVAAKVDAAQRVQHLDDVLDTLTEPALL